MRGWRASALAMLALGALWLCAGCQVVSAQGVPDAGARVDRPGRAIDGGVRDTRVDEEGDESAPDRVGGVRRARPDGGVRWVRRDGGVRRRARDAGTSIDAPVEAVDASASPGAGLEVETAPPDASVRDALVSDASVPGALFADAGGADMLSLDGSVPTDAGMLLADAAADAIDAGAMIEDAGVSTALLLDATVALDAGAPLAVVVADAGPATSASPATPAFDPWELLARLAGSSDDDEERAPSTPSITPLPDIDDAMWDRLETLVPALPSGRANMFALLVLLAIAVLIVRALGRARRALPDRGVIPRVLAVAHGIARLAIAALVLASFAELLPDWARSALPWVVVAGAVALGWSSRDLLPDLVAGAVLLTERRVSRGQHLVVAEHAGVVTDVGLRVTTLRDTSGRELRVPNRIVLSSTTTTRRTAWHAVTVRVRAPDGVPPDAFARALREAVLLSPWIPVSVVAEIARDPDEPCTFDVRTTLLDLRFEARFRGELLARAEAVLAAAARAPSSSAS